MLDRNCRGYVRCTGPMVAWVVYACLLGRGLTGRVDVATH